MPSAELTCLAVLDTLSVMASFGVVAHISSPAAWSYWWWSASKA